jgi:hypothetical protein
MPLPPLSTEERDALRALVNEENWRRGTLRYLLHSEQQKIYDHIAATSGRYVMEIARRFGKTVLLLTLAYERAFRRKCRVVYGAPTLKHLAEFIIPVVEWLNDRAPAQYKPHYNSNTGHVEFYNGSHIALFGADDKRKADRGRGAEADLAIFDEAGFTPVLRYVLRSVFRPQLLHTGGRVILGSTPAELPDHDFTALAEKAEATGNYARRTIHDNPLLTPARIAEFVAEDARDEGVEVAEYLESDDFRREYLAERVVDRLLVVVPEWAKHAAQCTGVVQRPAYFDAWVALDKGGADPHAVLFGYYHFTAARDVVERELLLKKGENTLELAAAIKEVECELWGVSAWNGTLRGNTDPALFSSLPEYARKRIDGDAPTQPYWRISDNDLHLVRDLYDLHQLQFCPTAKDDKELQVNNFRVAVVNHKWLVNPGCTNTIRHIATTTWANDKRQTYARRGGEHGDLLDCAVYKHRNPIRRNPYPPVHQPGSAVRLVESALEESMLGDTPLARKLLGRR